MTFKQLLTDNEFVLLDGAMGTTLQKNGLKIGELPELLNITRPELIQQIHSNYIKSGAQIIYANTFGANSFKLESCGYSVAQIINSAISNARLAAKGNGTLVALDIGPLGKMLAPSGELSFDDAYNAFKEQLVAAKDADIVVIETMTDLLEMKAAVLAAKENCNLPIMCTMTFEKNFRTFSGTQISAMALTLEGLGVDAIGINCSLGPYEMCSAICELSKWTTLPIIAKPNAGLPDPSTNLYSLTPSEFAASIVQMIPYGVKIFGGCCGADEQYIKEIATCLKGKKHMHLANTIPTAVCSNSKTVVIDTPKIIGERINPTGKKLFKEALKCGDINYIVAQALEEVDAGADILDVNVGLPEIDEKIMMVQAVNAIQKAVNIPLQIDSTSPSVLESALRIYNGKAIVNSVNGEESSLNTILPIVKKYGAAVICLTLDENGIPQTAGERVKIAEKILKRALEYGIKKCDIIIDCLTLTASAEQQGAIQTLTALKAVKEKLNLKTALGVSNISFGLPCREIVNRTFLTMALSYGLDLAIINPNNSAMRETFFAYNVLANVDKNSAEYIQYCNATAEKAAIESAKVAPLATFMQKETGVQKVATTDATNIQISNANSQVTPTSNSQITPTSNSQVTTTSNSQVTSNLQVTHTANSLNAATSNLKSAELTYAINHGLESKCASLTKELLEAKSTLSIVNEIIIPALDNVGILFEKGTFFLPQLITSANAAGACFEVIKSYLALNKQTSESKGTIIIATVKGDLHDIGKNIVKVVLENYGYTIIDLGKDVAPLAIVDAIKARNVKLVGLSALMTTTLKSMQNTITLIRENKLDCQIFVGGAVLTKEYALSIGADFYCKDAKEAVDVAKNIFK